MWQGESPATHLIVASDLVGHHTDHVLMAEAFYSLVKSHEWIYQLRAVQKAHDAAVRLGLPVPTWERPAVLPL